MRENFTAERKKINLITNCFKIAFERYNRAESSNFRRAES